MDVRHIPVLLEEVLNNLVVRKHCFFVDATVGGGGHAYSLLERFEGVRLIGIDVDEDALKVAREKLQPFKDRVKLVKGNFRDVDDIVRSSGISSIDGILFDLGLSTYQVAGKRGFSFYDENYLDMRMDREGALTAYDVVNHYNYEELKRIFVEFGEERKAPRIARAILEARKKKTISTGKDLSGIVSKAVGRRGRLHPATKIFQAIRIEVNSELKNLEKAITCAMELLTQKGRIGIISFHSLEDRIVKNMFKNSPALMVLTKKPIRPSMNETRENVSARSAKLRIAEKR